MTVRKWNDREFDLLETLTCRVRVLSRDQIQLGWSPQNSSARDINRELQRLVDGRLIATSLWVAQRPPIGQAPLFAWRPGAAGPEPDALTALVRNRWTEQPACQRVYVATPLAARLMGSSAGRFPAANHRNHDLLLAAVYVRYRVTCPELARRWIGEDALPMAEAGVKNPDAFLIDNDGRRRHAVESAGRYSREQLELFHEYCRAERLSYELW